MMRVMSEIFECEELSNAQLTRKLREDVIKLKGTRMY